jgi:hypothetical protein
MNDTHRYDPTKREYPMLPRKRVRRAPRRLLMELVACGRARQMMIEAHKMSGEAYPPKKPTTAKVE